MVAIPTAVMLVMVLVLGVGGLTMLSAGCLAMLVMLLLLGVGGHDLHTRPQQNVGHGAGIMLIMLCRTCSLITPSPPSSRPLRPRHPSCPRMTHHTPQLYARVHGRRWAGRTADGQGAWQAAIRQDARQAAHTQ